MKTRIEDGAEWIELKVGDKLFEGDEFQSRYSQIWKPISEVCIGKRIVKLTSCRFIRRVRTPEERGAYATVQCGSCHKQMRIKDINQHRVCASCFCDLLEDAP